MFVGGTGSGRRLAAYLSVLTEEEKLLDKMAAVDHTDHPKFVQKQGVQS